jgi:serine/threonine-protein kinase
MKRYLLSNSIVLTILALLLMLGSYLEWRPLRFPEALTYDRLLPLRTAAPSSEVVLVAIDPASTRQIGPWPWPRDVVAQGIQRLSRSGATAVGVNLLYPERALNPALKEIEALQTDMGPLRTKSQKQLADRIARRLQAVHQRLDQDRYLINAVRSGTNVVLPYRIVWGPPDGGPPPELSGLLTINSRRVEDAEGHPPTPLGHLQQRLSSLHGSSRVTAGIQETFRDLAGKAGALGFINVVADSDGVVRRLPLLQPYRDRYLAAMTLQLALRGRGTTLKQIGLQKCDGPACDLEIAGEIIPTDRDHAIYINFPGASGPAHRLSYAALMDDQADLSIVKGKTAVIGLTDGAYAPTYMTSAGRTATAPEIAAAALDTLLSGRFLQRPGWAPLLEGAVLLYFLFFLLIVIPRVRLRIGGLILIVFLATWWGVATVFFLQSGYWLWFYPPLLLCLTGYSLTALRQIARRLRSENLALNRSLGLSFQAQGMLDMAFDKFLKCPVEDKTVRDLLYNLALDFERKRMADKALAVYEHILKAGRFKDVKRRVKRLREHEKIAIRPEGPNGAGATLRLSGTDTLPTFGRYEIMKELGQGAMGTVYLGRDPKINRQVAIKTLQYGSVPAEELAEVKARFFREAEAAGKLSHPNIVTVFDIGEEHDIAYMAMELLEGTELTPYCHPGQILDVPEVLDIMASVADALAYAHEQGVVHRDIKPANIMRLQSGTVKVTDFGIARVMDKTKTQTGIVMGTPSYMSPEQVAGKKVDGRSDLFSLGVVFYEMLTGRKPFEGETIAALMYAISKAPFTHPAELVPDLPPCCIDIVGKMLNKGVTRRYKSAQLALEAIRQCQDRIG